MLTHKTYLRSTRRPIIIDFKVVRHEFLFIDSDTKEH